MKSRNYCVQISSFELLLKESLYISDLWYLFIPVKLLLKNNYTLIFLRIVYANMVMWQENTHTQILPGTRRIAGVRFMRKNCPQLHSITRAHITKETTVTVLDSATIDTRIYVVRYGPKRAHDSVLAAVLTVCS
jgi:hypothetical protein